MTKKKTSRLAEALRERKSLEKKKIGWRWMDGKVDDHDLVFVVADARKELKGFNSKAIKELWKLLESIMKNGHPSSLNNFDLLVWRIFEQGLFTSQNFKIPELDKTIPLTVIFAVTVLHEVSTKNKISAFKAGYFLLTFKNIQSSANAEAATQLFVDNYKKLNTYRKGQSKGGVHKSKNQAEELAERNTRILFLEKQLLKEGMDPQNITNIISSRLSNTYSNLTPNIVRRVRKKARSKNKI